MATIDPNIALSVKPIQIENPMNQYAAMSQIQNAQNQNALAQYQLSSAKRADEATNIQNQLYAKHYNPETGQVNKAGFFADLAQTPAAGLIPKLQTQFSELEHKENLNKKVTAETSKLNYDQKMKQYNNAISHIGSLNTPQEAIASINQSLTKGEIDQNQADTLVKSLSTAPNFLDWKKKIVLGSMEGKDQLHQEYQDKMANIAGGNLGVAQANLAINQEKAKREQTMGTIPAGYRLAPDGQSLEAIPGGPTNVPLAPKELQAREAKFPQATTALKTFDATSDNLIKDLERLKKHPGLSNITGVIAGRTPSLTTQGREAQALYDKILARGGFQELQALRQSSPTGGALGNVSNQEGQSLRQAFGALDRTQDASSIRSEIDRLVENISGAKSRLREAYDMTYDYKNNTGVTQQPPINSTTPVSPTAKKPSLNEIFSSSPKP